MIRIRWILLAGLVLLVLGGCSFSDNELVDTDYPGWDGASGLSLAPGQPVGQTFVAHHGGLAGLDLYLLPEGTHTQKITLHLRADPTAETDLAMATLELPAEAAPDFYRFAFPPLGDSLGKYYYAFVESAAPGVSAAPAPGTAVALADGATYPDGTAYQAHRPLDAQTAFRLAYAPGHAELGLFRAAVGWLGLLAAAGLLFVVPGWALLAWLWPGRGLTWPEMLGLAVGISLALYPLLFLWTDLLGFHLGPWYAWLPPVVGLGTLAWRYRTWRPREGWQPLKEWALSRTFWPDLALVALLGLVFGIRLFIVRTLDAPLWGDSYQHTMIAQLLLDNGGLFDSWEPYAPYTSLTVHYGFPATSALLAWITGESSAQATLLMGQILNGLAILTLYPLAVRFADGNRWAGVGVVLAAGLVSPMPAHYVNWGRYAQLAGQAILPTAIWLTWEAARRRRVFGRAMWLAGAVLAGMLLHYYRMPFYYGTFMAVWLLSWGLPHWRGAIRQWVQGLATLFVVAVVALALFAPWLLQITGGWFAEAIEQGVTQASPLNLVLADYQIWRDVTIYVPQPLLVLALVAWVVSLVKRRWVVASTGLWVLILAALVAGRLINMPGANMIQSFAILIALYIPVGLLVGWLTGQGSLLMNRLGGRIGQGILALALVALALWAMGGQARQIDPYYTLVTRPDARAMDWIRDHTDPDARFLVEGFRIWEGLSAVGADAGWWLPLLAERGNTMPPQYALVIETPAEPTYSQQIIDLVAQLETVSPASTEGVQLLCDRKITHVYVGQKQGKAGTSAAQLFSPDEFETSPAFTQIYHQDRVHVFALDPQACEASQE